MNDARVDHIEETLASLDRKFDGLSVQLHESTERLDGRIDALTAEMKAGFNDVFVQVQAGFDDHRRYAEFLVQGVREDMSKRFNQVDRRFDGVDERFDHMDGRFDLMDGRFDRLEELIRER